MKKRFLPLAAALGVLLPASLWAQQDPALVGQGAADYSAHCGRCHTARASTERTDAEWATIVMHMRARANLTGQQSKAILAYLQATNLPEGSTGSTGGQGQAEAASGSVSAPNVVAPPALLRMLARMTAAGPSRPPRGEDPGGS